MNSRKKNSSRKRNANRPSSKALLDLIGKAHFAHVQLSLKYSSYFNLEPLYLFKEDGALSFNPDHQFAYKKEGKE